MVIYRVEVYKLPIIYLYKLLWSCTLLQLNYRRVEHNNMMLMLRQEEIYLFNIFWWFDDWREYSEWLSFLYL